MRTIDADALVAQWEVDAEQVEDVIAKMFIYGAIRDVNHAPTIETEQRWIPCSERLPEERGFYLTTTKDKAVYCDYWNDDNFDRTEMVIAWMPLPIPYMTADD